LSRSRCGSGGTARAAWMSARRGESALGVRRRAQSGGRSAALSARARQL